MVGFPPLKLAYGENPPYPPVPSGTPVALKFATGNPSAPQINDLKGSGEVWAICASGGGGDADARG